MGCWVGPFSVLDLAYHHGAQTIADQERLELTQAPEGN